MSAKIELNQGEVKINFSSPIPGKVSFKDLGLTDKDLVFESGFVRFVFDFEGIKDHDYYKVPLVEVSYKENMAEIHWQCDFNKETILDKTDNHGHSSIMLLSKKRLGELEQHHQNKLVVHGEFPEAVNILAESSYINFFK
jgi:hypothetical protein